MKLLMKFQVLLKKANFRKFILIIFVNKSEIKKKNYKIKKKKLF